MTLFLNSPPYQGGHGFASWEVVGEPRGTGKPNRRQRLESLDHVPAELKTAKAESPEATRALRSLLAKSASCGQPRSFWTFPTRGSQMVPTWHFIYIHIHDLLSPSKAGHPPSRFLLQMETLRFREFKQLAQGHTAGM